MTDRELLEAAARAAGIEGTYIDLLPHPYISTYEGGPGNYRRVQWNPLQDDAQALRLAVKLGLQVRAYPIYEEPKHSVLVQKGAVTSNGYQVDVAAVSCAYDDSDPYAATRRAIVRAAAAIGRAS